MAKANACEGHSWKGIVPMTAINNQSAVEARISDYVPSSREAALLVELYKKYGRYSDPDFQRRIFEGMAFRKVLAACDNEEWLWSLCTELHDFRYAARF